MNSWSIFDLDRIFFVILMKPKCCYYYFFPLGRILLCVHIYLGRWNQSSNAKQICTHRRSYLKYASNFESEVWKEFKCVLTLLCIQTKRGEEKVYFGLTKTYKYDFFCQRRLRNNTFVKGKMFIYICNTRTKPILIGMLYKLILIR